MDRKIELTDLMDNDNETVVVVEPAAVRRIIRGWYQRNTTALLEDSDKIDEFHEAVNEQDYELARDLAAELGIGFDELEPVPGY